MKTTEKSIGTEVRTEQDVLDAILSLSRELQDAATSNRIRQAAQEIKDRATERTGRRRRRDPDAVVLLANATARHRAVFLLVAIALHRSALS